MIAESNGNRSPFLRFMVVGSIGFCIDGGVLTILQYQGWNVFFARGVSFILAVTTTWLLHLAWTFGKNVLSKPIRKYSTYLAIQISGATLNICIFSFLILLFPFLGEAPLIPLALASLVALIFNYSATSYYLFKT